MPQEQGAWWTCPECETQTQVPRSRHNCSWVPGHFARTEFGYEGDEIPKPPKQKKAKVAPKPKPPPKPKAKKKAKAKPAPPPARQARVSGNRTPQRRATPIEEEIISELQNFVTQRIGGIANRLLSRFTDVMNQRNEEEDDDDPDGDEDDSEELEALDEGDEYDFESEEDEDDDTDEEDELEDDDDEEVVANDAEDYGVWDDFRR